MVLLSMSPQLAAVVDDYVSSGRYKRQTGEPDLSTPAAGNPITHGQVLEISSYKREQCAKEDEANTMGHASKSYLADLLKGCGIYVPPAKPKAEPTAEFKALMARLRAEEEARQYERMINPPSPPEAFADKFPRSQLGNGIVPSPYVNDDDDEMTYADINRQVGLIFNVLVSIVCCAAALWYVASRWDTPSRLFLSMGGSIVVAVAEVVIYSGYIGRLRTAKEKERRKVERKEITNSWVIEAKGPMLQQQKTLPKSVSASTRDDDVPKLRRRTPRSSENQDNTR